jgi:hypothetical protein
MPPCDVPYCLLKGLSKNFEKNTWEGWKIGKKGFAMQLSSFRQYRGVLHGAGARKASDR